MIKIGIDLVSIKRIEKILNKFKIEQIKFLNKDELYTNKAETIAGIFASKEAFSKALGTGIGKDFSFKDISIIKNQKNKPIIKINSPSLSQIIEECDVSITHEDGFAIAAVILKLNKF